MEAAGCRVKANNEQQIESHKHSDACPAPVAPGVAVLSTERLASLHGGPLLLPFVQLLLLG